MARPQKSGLDYFPLDVGFFSDDRRIKILKARYGVDGIVLYLYFLCEIYKNGYFLQVDTDFEYVVSDDLGMESNKVKQVLNFLLERSLFDNKLFQSDKILTSAGIQKRYQLAVKERAKKKPIEVKDYWILEDSETEPFIKVNPNTNKSQKNADNSGINLDKSREESPKESKVKESKEKEGASPPPMMCGKHKNVCLTAQERAGLVDKFGEVMTADYIERLSLHLFNSGRRCRDYSGTIEKWIREDQGKEHGQGKTKNQFHNFEQRQTDYDGILRRMNQEG